VGDDCIALKGTKGPLALEDLSSPPVENVVVEHCVFDSGHGMVTCGSEATIIRNVTARDCRVGDGIPVVRFKLRPDTPQLYENFVFDGISMDRAQALFDVKPWSQFLDLQGHPLQKSVVRNVVVQNVTGTVRSLGELRGNDGDVIANIVLENVDVASAAPRLRTGEVTGLRMNNVRVNGEPLAAE
jgi:alpha-L-rhamnosidase